MLQGRPAASAPSSRIDTRFLAILALATALFLFTLFLLYQSTSQTVEINLYKYHQSQIDQAAEQLQKKLESQKSLVHFLHGLPPVSGIVRATENGGVDPYDGTALAQWKSRLKTIFVEFLRSNPDVRQARYIGLADNGMELVRVDRQSGDIRIVDNAELQAKSDRRYFKQALSLPEGSVFMSDINLNREHGRIETPTWSTYRILQPVFDSNNQMFGFIILNFDARGALDVVRNIKDDGSVFLINARGYFLINPNPVKEFAFERGENVTWQTDTGIDLPTDTVDHWHTHAGKPKTLYRYVSETVQLGDATDNRHLYIVLGISHAYYVSQVKNQFVLGATIASATFLVAIIIIYLYQRALNANKVILDLEAHYTELFNSSSDAIVTIATDGTILQWNTSARHLFQYSTQELLGESFIDNLVKPPYAVEVSHLLNDATHGKQRKPLEIKCKSRSGEILDVSFAVSPISGSDGRIDSIAAIMRDIKEQKLASEALSRLNSELEQQVRQRTEELAAAKDKAVKANRAKSAFLANMSHEIRTPMNGVFGMLSLIKKDPLTPRQATYIAMAESSVKALTTLINDILDFSKIEAGKLDFESTEFNLPELIYSSCCSLAVNTYNKGLEFYIDDTDIDTAWIVADPNRIRQVLNNLLSNAIKFTHSGHILLEAKTNQGKDNTIWLHCSVTDTGKGISREHIPRLFKDFSQETSSIAREYGGTGLGLSISSELCRLMGGKLSVSSREGEGSCFSFSLPVIAGKQHTAVTPVAVLENIPVCILQTSITGTQILSHLLTKLGAQVTVAKDASSFCLHPQKDHENHYHYLFIEHSSYLQNRHILDCFLEKSTDENPMQIVVLQTTQEYEGSVGLEDSLRILALQKPISRVNLQALLKGQHGESSTETTGITKSSEQLFFSNSTALVVDDHIINREVMAGFLEDAFEKILFAKQGREAIELLKQSQAEENISIIFMDCQMPEMDGYEATHRIRIGEAGSLYKSIPIIALTAGAMEGEREHCLHAGMNDYLSKPASFAKVIEKLQQFLPNDLDRENNSFTALDNKADIDEADENINEDKLEQILPNDTPAWHKNDFLQRINRDQELLDKLVDIYKQTTPGLISSIRSAMEARDMEKLKKEAHALKGISENISALQIAELCKYLEKKSTDISDPSLEYIASHLKDYYQHWLEQIQ